MTFSNPITGGQGTLVRPAIKSPDYDPGVSGWTINRDGSAEFNDLKVRGTFEGTDFVINSSGQFLYSGTPAAGNLVASAAPVAGTDDFGNEYQAGFATYGIDSFGESVISQLFNGAVSFWQPGTTDLWFPGGISMTSLSGNDSFRLDVNPPASTDNTRDFPILQMYTSSENSGTPSEVQLTGALIGFFPSNNADRCIFSVNDVDQGLGNVDFVARQTDTATTTTTETVALTSADVAFVADRAYRVRVHGLVQSSVSGDTVTVRVRKTNTAGDTLLDSARLLVIPGAGVQALCDLEVVVITNSTPPTDHLVMTFFRGSGTGNVVVRANASNPAYLSIEDIGAAADFPSARLLS